MKEHIESLIEALRQELQQYGEMLALLDQQQELVIRRESDPMLDLVTQIEAQAAVLQTARDQREIRRAALAATAGLAREAAFAQILPKLPADYRPLLRALVDENNTLLHRVRQRSRQNHILLSRAVEMMQKLLGSVFPSARTLTYSGAGHLIGGSRPAHSLYEAVG